MKKSIIAIAVAACLVFSGCASGSGSAEPEVTDKLEAIELEKEAEQLADDIEALELGPDIGDEIDRIKEAYEAFPDEIRKYVDNYDDFEALADEYDIDMEAVQDAIDAIDDIGTVDENSMGDIDHAQNLLNMVNPLFTELVDNADEIDAARTECRQAIVDKGVEEARSLIQAGKYEDAIDYVSDYKLEHAAESIDTTDLTAVSQEAELYWGWDLYNRNLLGYVQDIIDDLEWTAVNDEIASARDNLQQTLDNYLYSVMPANGTILAATISGGYGELTIYSGDSPMLVKIEGYGDASRYIYVFLRANSSTTFNVPDGYYIVKYATGDRYFGDTASKAFGSDTSYRQADDVLQFETTQSGNYIYYSVITLTLYYVSDGNMSTHSIDGF